MILTVQFLNRINNLHFFKLFWYMFMHYLYQSTFYYLDFDIWIQLCILETSKMLELKGWLIAYKWNITTLGCRNEILMWFSNDSSQCVKDKSKMLKRFFSYYLSYKKYKYDLLSCISKFISKCLCYKMF